MATRNQKHFDNIFEKLDLSSTLDFRDQRGENYLVGVCSAITPYIVLFMTKINTKVVKVLGTPVSGQWGSLWTLTQKTHFPKKFFDETRYISRLL